MSGIERINVDVIRESDCALAGTIKANTRYLIAGDQIQAVFFNVCLQDSFGHRKGMHRPHIRSVDMDYLIYIVTMTICVTLFYSFLSISSSYYEPGYWDGV